MLIMKTIQIVVIAMVALATFEVQAQQIGNDSTNHEVPAIESRNQEIDTDDANLQSDTLTANDEIEADTTSTRTFGTAPGTGATGAGSGNGDAAGNTGTPGSATMKDKRDGGDKSRETGTP